MYVCIYIYIYMNNNDTNHDNDNHNDDNHNNTDINIITGVKLKYLSEEINEYGTNKLSRLLMISITDMFMTRSTLIIIIISSSSSSSSSSSRSRSSNSNSSSMIATCGPTTSQSQATTSIGKQTNDGSILYYIILYDIVV